MWPEAYPKICQETQIRKDMEDTDIVPETLIAMLDWAHVREVGRREDKFRRYSLVHSQPVKGHEGAVCEVVCRLQGIVESCSLSTLGSWNT